MKFLKRVSLFIIFPAVFFVSGFLVCYFFETYFYPGKENSKILLESESLTETKEKTEKKIVNTPDTKTKEELAVSNGESNITTCDTVFLVYNYDKLTGMQSITKESIPFEFIGLTREELIDADEQYNISPSFLDLQNGFSKMEIEVFSSKQVTVSKYFDTSEEKQDAYYLKVVDNMVIVYQSDMETVFINTEIPLSQLPDDLQEEIMNIKCLSSIEAVYDFLESYSS